MKNIKSLGQVKPGLYRWKYEENLRRMQISWLLVIACNVMFFVSSTWMKPCKSQLFPFFLWVFGVLNHLPMLLEDPFELNYVIGSVIWTPNILVSILRGPWLWPSCDHPSQWLIPDLFATTINIPSFGKSMLNKKPIIRRYGFHSTHENSLQETVQVAFFIY
jgi:hypothetical protein